MGNAVENAATGLELVFNHFETFLRQITPGFIYLIAFHWSWDEWPESEHVWMEVGAAPFLGCLIYALGKATVNRFCTLRSVNIATGGKEGPPAPESRVLRWYYRWFLRHRAGDPDKAVREVDFARWLRRVSENRGPRQIQKELSTWATSTVFVQCAGLAILLASLTPGSWPPWDSLTPSRFCGDVSIQKSLCCSLASLFLLYLGYRTGQQVTLREKLLNDSCDHDLTTGEVKEKGKKLETRTQWNIHMKRVVRRRRVPPPASNGSQGPTPNENHPESS